MRTAALRNSLAAAGMPSLSISIELSLRMRPWLAHNLTIPFESLFTSLLASAQSRWERAASYASVRWHAQHYYKSTMPNHISICLLSYPWPEIAGPHYKGPTSTLVAAGLISATFCGTKTFQFPSIRHHPHAAALQIVLLLCLGIRLAL